MEAQVTTDLQSVKITKVFSGGIEEEIYFPSQFDEDMGETTIHLKQILLLEIIWNKICPRITQISANIFFQMSDICRNLLK